MTKNLKTILFGIGFLVLALFTIFIIDYFQMKRLLNNGVRVYATVIHRYYELNSDTKDTMFYSMRLETIPDTSARKTGIRLQTYVKKELFNKYPEGSVVEVVYYEDDKNHVRLVEEIE